MVEFEFLLLKFPKGLFAEYNVVKNIYVQLSCIPEWYWPRERNSLAALFIFRHRRYTPTIERYSHVGVSMSAREVHIIIKRLRATVFYILSRERQKTFVCADRARP